MSISDRSDDNLNVAAMNSVREHLWTQFRTDHHDMSPEEFISVLLQDVPGYHDTDLNEGDDIGFILAVHRVVMIGLGTPPAFYDAYHCALWAYLHLRNEDMQGLELLDALSTEPGWSPVRDYYTNP